MAVRSHARPAIGAVRRIGRPLYEDKGPGIFRKSSNKNLWDSNGALAVFLCLLFTFPQAGDGSVATKKSHHRTDDTDAEEYCTGQ